MWSIPWQTSFQHRFLNQLWREKRMLKFSKFWKIHFRNGWRVYLWKWNYYVCTIFLWIKWIWSHLKAPRCTCSHCFGDLYIPSILVISLLSRKDSKLGLKSVGCWHGNSSWLHSRDFLYPTAMAKILRSPRGENNPKRKKNHKIQGSSLSACLRSYPKWRKRPQIWHSQRLKSKDCSYQLCLR